MQNRSVYYKKQRSRLKKPVLFVMVLLFLALGGLIVNSQYHFIGKQTNKQVVSKEKDVIKKENIIDIGSAEEVTSSAEPTKADEEKTVAPEVKQENPPTPDDSAVPSSLLPNDDKVIAITFDDGPSGKTTPRLLDVLKKHNAKATFFLLGKRIKGREAIVKRMAKEGHEIGNHTWEHKNLTRCDLETQRKQILKTDKKLRSLGVKPSVFRPPYGNHNAQIDAIAKDMGYPVIMWSKDTLDWKYRNVSSVTNRFLKRLKSGDIVLLHDIHATSVDAMDGILTQLKKDGYRFLTVSELIKFENNGLLEAGKTFH